MRCGPLRVGLVYDDSLDRKGGIAQYLRTLAAGLGDRGHDVSLLVGDSPFAASSSGSVHSLSRNIPLRLNGNWLTTPVISSRKRIEEIVTDYRFDVLHVQVPYSPLMAGRIVGIAPMSTAVVGTCHVFSERAVPRSGARALRALCQRTLDRFDAFIAVSQPAADFAREYLGIAISHVIPNMVDVHSIASAGRDIPSRPRVRNWPLVVYLGALVPRKGVDGLIEGFHHLLVDWPDAHLTIAGDGPLASKLRRHADRLSLGPRVKFLGTVTELEKIVLLREADVACFPSRFGESFGVVLIEAMAAGAGIVLGGCNAGHRSVLVDDDALVDPDRPSDLSRKISGLLQNEPCLAALRAQQRRRVREFDAAEIVDSLESLYQQAVERRCRGTRLTVVRS